MLLAASILAISVTGARAQIGERRNFYGMHNLRDGGAAYLDGLDWTRHLVGEGGWAFDWVNDDTTWIKAVMDRGLIPCIRVQGGDQPSVAWTGSVAASISEWQTRMGPPYQNRLVYLQLWNEPGDIRDLVTPENFADYLVGAYQAVKAADRNGTLRVMTPGQNGPDWWRRALAHNPQAAFSFDVWATHPYPESYPPHYNHHDGVPFTNQVKTIDSYLLDLDVLAEFGRRGFPVMITETAYGDHLGISFEGYPKTTRELAARYNVEAFTRYWHNWPEIIAVHPFLLHAWAWEAFAWVQGGSRTNADGTPTHPYPQYDAVRAIEKPPSARREPYTGAVGTIRGRVTRADTNEPVKYATVYTDGREFGGPTLFDGRFVIREVPAGDYMLAVEKLGYTGAATSVSVREGEETVIDFSLEHTGKVSKGLYFLNRGTCSGCDLFAPFLGQTIRVPEDVGFIKFAAGMPNVGNVTMRFSILEGGPDGPQVGPPVSAFLEWGGEMIGAEWPGDGVPVTPGGTYFIKMERADGQGVYMYASDADPYPQGMAFTGGTPRPGWDLFATVRGKTVARDTRTGELSGTVRDESGAALAGATVRAGPGAHTATSAADGSYVIAGLAEGVYTVSVSLAGFAGESVAGVVVEAGGDTRVDFVLAGDVSSGDIGGLVTDHLGAPLAGAQVETLSGFHVATTDAGGRFTLAGLSEGTYTLRATKAGFEPLDETGVEVRAGEVTEVVLALAPLAAAPPELRNAEFEDDGGFFGVASGWTAFGSAKFEAVWDPQQVFTQGIADIEPSGNAGIAQGVTLVPGRRYRASVLAKSGNPDYEASVGVDVHGGADALDAVIGSGNREADWRRVDVEFTAVSDNATLFLVARNHLGAYTHGWVQFDDVVVEPLEGVGNTPPVAVASASPSAGTAPLLVLFDAGASGDADGDALGYGWQFGDGLAFGVTTTHEYGAAGSYPATLTVTDARGASSSAKLAIEVASAEPPPPPPPGPSVWDARLDTLGVYVEPAVVSPGELYWKLVEARFESDGEVLPPAGGGSESRGTHAIYVRALDSDGTPLEGQRAYGAWPTGDARFSAPLSTKGPIDGYWGDFPMSGGNWCPFYPEGPRGPYGAYLGDAPSDRVWGMGMPCNRHVSYRLTWQWTRHE